MGKSTARNQTNLTATCLGTSERSSVGRLYDVPPRRAHLRYPLMLLYSSNDWITTDVYVTFPTTFRYPCSICLIHLHEVLPSCIYLYCVVNLLSSITNKIRKMRQFGDPNVSFASSDTRDLNTQSRSDLTSLTRTWPTIHRCFLRTDLPPWATIVGRCR